MNVSVVIATFGELSWRDLALERALPSVDAQTVLPFEARLSHADTLAEARNRGAMAAGGDWLCFLDADDELEAGFLEAMTTACWDPWCPCQDGDSCNFQDAPGSPAMTPAPALLVPAVRYVDHIGRPLTEPAIPNAEPLRSLIEVNRAVIGSLIPREVFLDVGGFGPEPVYEDWALWLRCVRAGLDLVHVPGAVYRAWRRRGSRNQFTADHSAWYDRIRAEHEGSCAALTVEAG